MKTVNNQNKKAIQASFVANNITKRANWNNRRRYSL